jgi:hypothetical protein
VIDFPRSLYKAPWKTKPVAESPGEQANVARLRYQAATDQRNKRARRTEFTPLPPFPKPAADARRRKAEIVPFAHLNQREAIYRLLK